MPDHAAKAHRILTELSTAITRVETERAPVQDEFPVTTDIAPEVTAGALLAIAHTLQAIHGLMAAERTTPAAAASVDPCEATVRVDDTYGYKCTLPSGHAGNHRALRDPVWILPPCGAIAGTHTDTPCILPTGHPGDHTDADGDQW